MNAAQIETRRLQQRLETLTNTKQSRIGQVARLRSDRVTLASVLDQIHAVVVPVIPAEPLASQAAEVIGRWARDVQTRIEIVDRNIDATAATVASDDPEITELQEVLS